MNERKVCANCKWLRTQEPDYELMCYCGNGKHSFDSIWLDSAEILYDACDHWEAQPCVSLEDYYTN